MLNIKNYTDSDRITSLCREINMPNEAAIQIKNNVETMDFQPIEAAFCDLFHIDRGKSAYDTIDAFCQKEQNGLKALTVYLLAALHTREIYLEKGIKNEIYIDTMKMFARFVNEHFISYGNYGYDRGWWTYRILSSSLYRLGQLEFEMCNLKEDVKIGSIGDPVVSIHIPSDAVMTKEELDHSYKAAMDFFEKYYKDYHYKFMFTHTWLLAPALKQMLSKDSKILLFQSDYTIIYTDENDNSFMEWVYKKTYDDFNELPERTSLERNIKKHLLNSGKIGSAFGILKNNALA